MLLTLAFMIPVNEDNKTASVSLMEKEGWYPAIPMISASLDTYFHSYLPGVLDNSSDSVMIGSVYNVEEENALRAAMDMNGYSRYWHGYVSILRPLLAVFDYWEIRVINAMGQLLLVSLLFLFIYQKMRIRYSLMALTSYCLLMPLAMPFSLQYSWVFYITYGFLLYLASRKEGEIPEGIKLFRIFMVVGMLTSYFDLLTYPLYTWGIPIVWWLLLQNDSQKQSFYVRKVIYSGIWWLSGYAGMWIMKWCLGSIILKRNIFESALGQGKHWAKVDNSLVLSDRLRALYVNWKHYEYKLYVIILLAWLIAVFIWSMRNRVINHSKNKALLLVAASSAVWYFILSEHSRVHHFFTHRTWGISILAILALLIISTESAGGEEKRKRIGVLFGWGICSIIAFGLSFLPKEDVSVINGMYEYDEIPIAEGEICEMDFTPSFPVINSFMLCAKTDSLHGRWKIVVADGETELYEAYLPMEDYQDATFASIPVLWKLKKEKIYSMRISVEEADKDTYLLITKDHSLPLSEYSEIKINGILQNGQILSAIIYRYRALSKTTLCVIWIGWMGVLTTIWIAFFVRSMIDGEDMSGKI